MRLINLPTRNAQQSNPELELVAEVSDLGEIIIRRQDGWEVVRLPYHHKAQEVDRDVLLHIGDSIARLLIMARDRGYAHCQASLRAALGVHS